jgi:hypothetical protein
MSLRTWPEPDGGENPPSNILFLDEPTNHSQRA